MHPVRGLPIIEPNETLEAVRFLWAMTAVAAGLVELVHVKRGPDAERMTCRNKQTGAMITVSRRTPWTEEDEIRYAGELDRALNGQPCSPEAQPAMSEGRAAAVAAQVPCLVG